MAKSPGSALSRRCMLGQCDALIAVSNYVARVLREGVNEPDSPEPERHHRPPIHGDFSKVRVVYGGIDTERFRPFDAEDQRREWGLEPGDYAFGVCGAYDLPRGKGQREFLTAAAAIHREVPQARFLIIGRGNMAEILKREIARLGLTDKAMLTPYSQNMPRTMNALDCLVHPQIGTEAFGLVVCEASACGRPVIASALDGVPEAFAVGNHGQLVKPESVDELAAAMCAWAARPGLSDGERATMHQRVSEQVSLRAFGERMMKVYTSLL
jgi:glycosyltransferase involved in cell wall biosynthesis